jgi:hypothetical protein
VLRLPERHSRQMVDLLLPLRLLQDVQQVLRLVVQECLHLRPQQVLHQQVR